MWPKEDASESENFFAGESISLLDFQSSKSSWIDIILTMNEADRIMDLDGEWNEAYSRLDGAALDRIIANDWVCIDGAGLVITKSELLTRVASSASFLDPYKFDEIASRVFGEAAIVTGRLSGQMRDSDGTHDVNQRYMRVYVKRNERWQAVATQVTKIKETVLS